MHNFSVVIETLQGAGAGPSCKLAQNTTEPQTVSFSLSQELAAAVPPSGLSLWRTTAGALFVEQPKVLPSIRCASLALAPLPLIFSYKSEKSLCGTAPMEPRRWNSRLVSTRCIRSQLCREDFTAERPQKCQQRKHLHCRTPRALTRMRMIRWHGSSLIKVGHFLWSNLMALRVESVAVDAQQGTGCCGSGLENHLARIRGVDPNRPILHRSHSSEERIGSRTRPAWMQGTQLAPMSALGYSVLVHLAGH